MKKNTLLKSLLFTTLLVFLSYNISAQCTEPGSYTYQTISDGDWSSASTWLGGSVPSSNLGANQRVLITHNVNNSTASVSTGEKSVWVIKDGGLLTVNSFNVRKDADLRINNGKLVVTTGALQISKDSWFCAYESCIEAGTNIQFDKDTRGVSIENSGLKASSDITMRSKSGVSGGNIKLYAGNNITINGEGKWLASTISAWYAGGSATGFTGALPTMSDSSLQVCAPNSDLKVIKTVNTSSVPVGSTVIFTVTASNVVGVSEPNAIVQDLLPGGFTYINSTVTTGTYNSGTGLWAIGALDVGQSETMTISAIFNSSDVNTATITGDINDSNEANNSASADVSVPGESYCITGCNDNTFLNSVDPNTMEYDNIVGLYHSSMLKETDGKLLVWGASAKANGSDQLAPNAVTPANGYNYGGDILKFTGGSANGTKAQFTILTTDGLYFWGTQGALVRSDVKSGSSFGKGNALATEGESGTSSYSLPIGVSPEDVKMMYGTENTLVIVTCFGEAWVLSQNRYLYGDGITSTSSAYQFVWHRVSTASSAPLENVVAVRGTTTALMALTSDGDIYTWGQSLYLGNNTGTTNETFAVSMTKPSGVIKQIGMTGGNSYYVLNAIGELYSLGKNTSKELGDFSTSERRNWVRVQQSSSGTPLPAIAWISPNSHSSGSSGDSYASINALTTDGKLWSWGYNSFNMLGAGGSSIDPTSMVGGLDTNDRIMAVETGGHTTMVIKQCSTKFGYLGHKVNGSMGDGTSGSGSVPVFNFIDTADVSLCGAPTSPTVNDIEICDSGVEIDLNSYILSTTPLSMEMKWYTDIDRTTEVSNPEAVMVSIGDVFYAFYVAESGNCDNPTYTKVEIIQKITGCSEAVPDFAETDQDTPVSINVAENDRDMDETTLTIVDQPTNGTLEVNPTTGIVTYWPEEGYSGVDTFTYEICTDGTRTECSTAEVTITVNELPCSVPINGADFEWDFPSGSTSPVTRIIEQPAANAGFVIDIWRLDNSFNMEINGTDLATSEIEFQSSGTTGINIQFQDGAQYEANTQNIWEMLGTESTPLIRVKIAPNGDVSMFGSKVSNGPLYPLELLPGTSFNNIIWNPNSSNTVVFTQNVQGVTNITGKGYGLNETQAPIITILETTNPTCLNGEAQNDGTISINVTGLSDGVYDFQYDGGTFQDVSVVNGEATVEGLENGEYSNIVIGSGNCMSPLDVNAVLNADCSACIQIVPGGEWNQSFSRAAVAEMPIKLIDTYDPITVAGTNAGMFFDIYRLDNSFNLKINGTSIVLDAAVSNELQFDLGTPVARTNNVRFLDGGLYSVDADPIWKIIGTAAKPAVRVEVSPEGKVTLYGSKVSGGPLYQLRLFNGAQLNDVDWFVDADNTIEVTQDAYGTTRLFGKVFGESICSTGFYKLTKTAAYDNSQPAAIGDIIEYSIKVENVGNEDVFEIVVVDPLLGGEITDAPTGDINSDFVLNVGETWTYTLDYEITAEDIARQGVYNLATVFAKDRNNNPIPTLKSFDPNNPGGTGNPDCESCTFTAITADCDLIFPIVSDDPFYWAFNYGTYKNRQAPETNSGTIVGTNEGFEFDIYRLDNSFNMIINGVKLYDDEIQFDAKLTPGVNIEFVGGGEYGKGSIPRILSLRGNQEKPMVRVKVSAAGVVQLFGSKTSYGSLVELKPKTGSFNNITWKTNPNENNTITVTQEVWWKTVFEGYGYGVHVDCNPGKPEGDQPVAVNDATLYSAKYYPNPVNNTLYVQANTVIEEIEIYNVLGQRVINLRPNTNETEINVEYLQADVYMMKVTLNGKVETYRVIKE